MKRQHGLSQTAGVEIETLQQRAVAIRRRLATFEEQTYGSAWTVADLLAGLSTDVGDLARIVQQLEGRRPSSADARVGLAHELGDCLWVLLVLADRYEVDLAAAFTGTMDGIERWLDG